MTSYNRGYGRSSSGIRRYGRGGYGMGGVSGVSWFEVNMFSCFDAGLDNLLLMLFLFFHQMLVRWLRNDGRIRWIWHGRIWRRSKWSINRSFLRSTVSFSSDMNSSLFLFIFSTEATDTEATVVEWVARVLIYLSSVFTFIDLYWLIALLYIISMVDTAVA